MEWTRMPAFMDNDPKKGKRNKPVSRGLESRRQIFNVEFISNTTVTESIAYVLSKGGAIRLGLTRDGGALAIGIYGDGEPYTVYARPGEDIVELFGQIARLFAELE